LAQFSKTRVEQAKKENNLLKNIRIQKYLFQVKMNGCQLLLNNNNEIQVKVEQKKPIQG